MIRGSEVTFAIMDLLLQPLWYFSLAFGISLLGSLPFGMINLNVLATAVHRGPRPALWMGLGATLVEGLQILLVLFGFQWLADNTTLDTILQWIAIPVFLGLAFHYFTAKPARQEAEVIQRHPFLRGVGLSLINVLVYPFWFLWLGLMDFPVDDRSLWGWMIAGAVLGAFAVMALFVLLGRVIEKHAEAITRSLNQIIATVFIGLGVIQLLRLM